MGFNRRRRNISQDKASFPTKYRHKEVGLLLPNGSIVMIDEGLVGLINLLWTVAGVRTNFCCEGYVYGDADQTDWDHRDHRAYIQMARDENSMNFILGLMHETSIFMGDTVSWSIHFDRNPHTEEQRICIRFPNQDIQVLENYILNQAEFTIITKELND